MEFSSCCGSVPPTDDYCSVIGSKPKRWDVIAIRKRTAFSVDRENHFLSQSRKRSIRATAENFNSPKPSYHRLEGIIPYRWLPSVCGNTYGNVFCFKVWDTPLHDIGEASEEEENQTNIGHDYWHNAPKTVCTQTRMILLLSGNRMKQFASPKVSGVSSCNMWVKSVCKMTRRESVGPSPPSSCRLNHFPIWVWWKSALLISASPLQSPLPFLRSVPFEYSHVVELSFKFVSRMDSIPIRR